MNHLRNITNLMFIRTLNTTRRKLKATEVSAIEPEKKIDSQEKELVPSKPVPSKINLDLLPPRTVIDAETIALLERLSLVDCANKQSIQILEDAIHFADQIQQVDTTGIEPLITVLEDRPLETREDVVTDGNIRDDILSNAAVKEDEYLVAPPGNIPLESRENLLHEEKLPTNQLQ